MSRIAVFTSITPNKMNDGGVPSGLIWEIINKYKENNIVVDVIIKPESNNRILRVLHRYGIYLDRNINFDDYDYLIVYPENLIMSLSPKTKSKVIVLGPDSPSLRDSRIYKYMKPCLLRFLKCLYKYISYIHEYRLVKQAYKVVVVGRTDQLWMQRNPFICKCAKLKSKIKFLRHPMLTNVISKKIAYSVDEERIFVFSGDLSYIHNCKFLESVIDVLEFRLNDCNFCELNILVIGKNNRWIYERLNSINNCHVRFCNWVENYNDVCIPGKHIHCMPLLVGAGSKNRTITALANGLEVITTPVGIENIPWQGLSGCYITVNPEKFVEYMLMLQDKQYDKQNIEDFIAERIQFRKRVNALFDRDFKKIFDISE